jgi:soluble epoxide hydrolase / lipid-phosphate phosphatase
LFIAATKDLVLKPEMAARMGRNFSNLTTKDVIAGHWALWEASENVNQHLQQWMTEQVFELKSTL